MDLGFRSGAKIPPVVRSGAEIPPAIRLGRSCTRRSHQDIDTWEIGIPEVVRAETSQVLKSLRDRSHLLEGRVAAIECHQGKLDRRSTIGGSGIGVSRVP
jgi:hypothetical protein